MTIYLKINGNKTNRLFILIEVSIEKNSKSCLQDYLLEYIKKKQSENNTGSRKFLHNFFLALVTKEGSH